MARERGAGAHCAGGRRSLVKLTQVPGELAMEEASDAAAVDAADDTANGSESAGVDEAEAGDGTATDGVEHIGKPALGSFSLLQLYACSVSPAAAAAARQA